jgi:hypothetical protein
LLPVMPRARAKTAAGGVIEAPSLIDACMLN